ncbi:MAG: hypothetical protein K0S53_2720 [Bacteroidetes bacterium]|jgi:hypothetical protein|nr:hypothetical protein [Bacteroidota bacterium]MDF2451111.1 hypothetical protein [Bacteroidota bacterium]
MKFLCPILLLFSLSLKAQYTVKIKREDNRLLFFQIGSKTDTIIRNKSDLFLLKLPDSLKNSIQIFLKNGQFIATNKDSVYRLRPLPGMKYSHSKPDSVFQTLLEGNCSPSNIITVEFINTLTRRRILQNNFIVK